MGKPKVVVVSHGNVVRLFHATQRWFQFTDKDVWTLFHSYAFDFSVWEIWGALLHGGRLEVVPYWTSRTPEAFYELLRKKKVTVLNQTPSAFQQLSAVEEREGRGEEQGREELSLRLVIFGGEALEVSGLRGWFERHGDQRPQLVNMYGITETTVHVTWKELRGEVGLGRGEGRGIGVRIPDLQVYVMSGEQGLAPVGVAGEMYVGGAGLARGYLKRPELTAERFMPNPFADRGGERLYRTGDVGRYREDGSLEYLGRMDQQIKIRGHRIELGEIEAVLLEEEGVEQAVVVVREEQGNKRLVGYVRRMGGAELEGVDLRERLRERLPEYMVPVAVVMVEEMPLTINGKIDRQRLPEPEYGKDEKAGAEGRRELTPVEEILCGIYGEVLRQERVEVGSNFFDLGGHSLLATQVISRMRAVFGVELPVRMMFESPTVEGLARRVEQALREGVSGEELPPMVRVSREGRLPLSFAQQRLWFLHQLEPESIAYNIPLVVHLRGWLDRGVLVRALEEIVRRHEVLRTTFPAVEGEARQQIGEVGGVGRVGEVVEVEDLSQEEEQEREQRMQEMAEREATTPFDLGRGPLLRVRLLRMGPEEHRLLFTMHHIITDGWSMGILVREFVALYRAYAQGEETPLAELELQYADFAAWQREHQAQRQERELEYWRGQLAGLSVLELPTDYPRPVVASGRGRRSRVVFGEELVRQVEEFNRRQGVTMYMTLLAGYQMLLGRYCNQQDIAVGTVIANRNRLETEGLIGFFINTLVLRSRAEGRKRFAEFVGEVRGTVLSGYAHQDLPFERLVEELAPERMLGRTPLFQAMLVLQNLPEESLQLPGLELSVEENPNSTLPYDLLLTFTPTVGGGLEGLLQCSADLFGAETGERMAGHFVTLLQGLMERPEAALGTLPLLTAGERRQIEEEWNRTEEVVEGLCVQQLFEAQAERRGGAVALVCGGERLTYGELNERANQLAHYLRANDVGVETRVGLCCTRSVELVIGMLGILKAGGVYVPLDASYPEERLQWMVQDSGAVMVLTQEDLASHFLYVASTVVLDEDWESIGRYSGENPEVRVGPENLAYLIYTSGSTGEPKGVAVEQGSIVRLAGEKRSFRVGERDVCCLLSSVTFDASTFEIWVGLLNGAQVSIYGGFTPSLEELGNFKI